MKILLGIFALTTGLSNLEKQEFRCRHGQFKIKKSSNNDQCSFKIDEIGRFWLFKSNGIPDHDAGDNGDLIQPQNIIITIPKNPIMLEEPECVGQGIVGIALNGVPIYNAKTNGCCDSVIENIDRLDTCNGYGGEDGVYRYNIYPTCLQQCVYQTKSEVLGVALDGFPIYGPVDDDGAQLTTRDLDECHGKWHGSEYRYHVTADYPYFINCFRGRVPAQNKNTLVRRGRRETSYSWRQAARMPTVHKAVIFPLKMNECKICPSIKSCRSNNYGNSWTRPSQPMPRYSSISRMSSVPSVAVRLEPQKKAITRTLSTVNVYTPRKPVVHNSNFDTNFNNIKNYNNAQTTVEPVNYPKPERSLFSLYRPQYQSPVTTKKPAVWTYPTQKPTTKRVYTTRRPRTTQQTSTKPVAKKAYVSNVTQKAYVREKPTKKTYKRPSYALWGAPLKQRAATTTQKPTTRRPNNIRRNYSGKPKTIQNFRTSPYTPKTGAPKTGTPNTGTTRTGAPKTGASTSLKGMFNNMARLKKTNSQRARQTTRRITTTTPKQTTTPKTTTEEFDLKSVLESFRTGPRMRWKVEKDDDMPHLTEEELKQMLEDTLVSKMGKRRKIDPLIALLEDNGYNQKIKLTKKSGNAESFENVKTRVATSTEMLSKITQTPAQIKREKIENMWGNLNPNAARFRMANPEISTTTPTTTKSTITTTTPYFWRFTTPLAPWVQNISDRMKTENNSKDFFINSEGDKERIPDNIRHVFERNRMNNVPENLRKEALKIIEKNEARNAQLKKTLSGRGRRSVSSDELFIAMQEAQKARGKYFSETDAGFLTKKDDLTLIRCLPPNFKTPNPNQVDPRYLNPQLLEEMLKERKDFMKVKQSVFSRLFENLNR